MQKYTTFIIILLLGIGSCQVCSDYYQNEHGCVSSTGISCCWNENTNQCVDSSGTLLGCQRNLNLKACISQTFYPDRRVAECIFSGYCRDVKDDADNCQNNLSRAGCLGVTNSYCQWNGKCITLTDAQVQTLASATSITEELKLSSIKVCQAIVGFKAIHQHGAHSVLLDLYLTNLLKLGGSSKYSDDMDIPGCFEPDYEILEKIDCDANGLNAAACIQVTNGYCIFKDGYCQKVDDFSNLKCSDQLSYLACLSVTNFSETCFWEYGNCGTFSIVSEQMCESGDVVSPSVCANIIKDECFYDESTKTCKQKCKMSELIQKKSACNESKYGCLYNDKKSKCVFKDSQCDIIGQNLKACSDADQYCHFVDGHCRAIKNLNLLGCSGGLNLLACISLTNPSQVCMFFNDECAEKNITSDDQCEYQYNVNVNACKKITTSGCYWDNGDCKLSTGSQQCSTLGFNKIACLQTTNTISPCFWNGESGSCQALKITLETECQSLKMVNAIACKNISNDDDSGDKVLCKYNSSLYQCEVFTMSSTIKCTTEGLNEAACSSITDPTQSCRWQSNSCKSIVSLGSAVSCQSLQSVTAKTCAMIQSTTQKCVYDSQTKSCTTSVPPTLGCSALGLNPSGCAFQNSECYFDTTLNQCKETTAADYTTINCDVNWPSKKSCVLITTGGQYCKWIPKDNNCIQQSFPVTDNCEKQTQVNRKFCLAFEVSVTRFISSKNFCTFDSATSSCKSITSAIYDCGNTDDLNLHACVAKTDTAKFCYFDTETLKCTEIPNETDPKVSTLKCKYANQKLCITLTTKDEKCLWTHNQTKCESVTSTRIYCSDYTNDSNYINNRNLCSSADSNEACKFDDTKNVCAIVDVSVTDLTCANNGLNEKACINNTNEACFYDQENKQCLLVTLDLAKNIQCESSVNQKGCLATLSQLCYWDTDLNQCKQLTEEIDFKTIQCNQLNTKLFNPLVCGHVETTDQYCEYDSATNHCKSIDADAYIYECLPGYNYYTCSQNNNCKTWVYDYWNSEYVSYLCQDQSDVNSVCYQKKTENDCIAVTNDTCGWISSKCIQVPITSTLSCDQLTGIGTFNKQVCLSVIKTSDYCSYDAANKVCKVVTVENNSCNTDGLNYNACVSKTQGFTCYFEKDIKKENFGCLEITDFNGVSCQNTFNYDSCVKISTSLCYFDKSSNMCFQTDSWVLQQYQKCSDFSDPELYIVTESFCKFIGGNESCVFEPINKICKISTEILLQCESNTTINIVYCQNYIQNEICDFNWYYNKCMAYDTTYADCSGCNSKKQCLNSKFQACQWNGTTCQEAVLGTSCAALTNINSVSCMKYANNNEQCKFQITGDTTACIVPPGNQEPCEGLNKIACISNTLNACFYYQNSCYDIIDNPFKASCTSEFSFNQNGCVRIKNPNSHCQWKDGSCQSISVSSTDTCSKYADSNYSASVCASITTGNCVWNNGCKEGTANDCEVLGANQQACVGATTGNCVFSGVCQEMTNASRYIMVYCNNPSNKNGCLNINNGYACKWDGSICDYQDVSAGCATYTNVNPGVCGKTTDVACKWNNDACEEATVKGLCSDKGLNIKACLGFTDMFCYYDTQLSLCLSIDSYDKLKEKSCDDNLNEQACLQHPSKCCKWNTTNKTCSSYNPGSNCEALPSHSNYCCQNVVGDKCTYPYCSQMKDPYYYCSWALNQEACMYVIVPCRWDQNEQSCIYVQSSYGCKTSINQAACTSQTQHCKFINNECVDARVTDSCSDLEVSSLYETKCIMMEIDRCQQSDGGCKIPAFDIGCDNLLNQLACLDNINKCQWNATTKRCSTISTTVAPLTCPTGKVSRGYCSFAKVQCKLNMSDFTCIPITTADTCDQKNAVVNNNRSQCISIAEEVCQYDSTKLRCTSQIFGTVCESVITESGCKLILASCNWTNKSCQQNDPDQIFYKCESIFTKYQCLKNVNTACFWEENKCKTFNSEKKECINFTDSPISPGICYYFATDFCSHDGTKCLLESVQSICTNSKSPLGCQQNTSGNCYWDMEKGLCLIANVNLAQVMTCSLLKYSNKQFCVAPILEGQVCHWKDDLCQSANSQQILCLDDLSLYGCRAVAVQQQFCMFDTNLMQCKNANNDETHCSDIINIFACLAVTKDGEYCKWLGQKCSSLSTDDGYLIETHILINANTCRKTNTKNGQPDSTLPILGVKYDSRNYVCQVSDEKVDTCDTPGLNYYGCLMTSADTCDWNGSKCIEFVSDQEYTKCNQYTTVSAKVCASITITGQKCQHNTKTFNCEPFIESEDMFILDEDTQLYYNQRKGMNREACINVTLFPTIWIDGYCEYNQVKAAFDSCNSLENVNERSCALVNKDDEVCKYYMDGKCTQKFDGQIDTCNTQGLNIIGCVQVENGLCRFLDGFCQFYDIKQMNTDICTELINSNPNVCKNVVTSACKFSFVNRGCVSVSQYDKCSYQGLNYIGCKSISSCDWINSNCYCRGFIQLHQLQSCTTFDANHCLNDQCIVDNENCRFKQCSDLSVEKCTGKIGIMNCYLNKSTCSSALKCSDLKNITNCSDYTLNGKKCDVDQWNANHCVDKDCEHYQENQCSGDCQWQASYCYKKECIYMKKEFCSGIMNNKQCYWDGTYCQGYTRCQDYIKNSQETDSTKLKTLCNSNSILNKQCKWELIKPYGTDYHCTSAICYSQGQSQTNCNGVEIGQEVCVLLPDYSCVSCSEITDICTCMSMNGYCYYLENKGCISFQCKDLDQQSCVLNQLRCVPIGNECKVLCQKLRKDDCNTRAQQNECHWDSNVEKCLEGSAPVININTIADVVTVIDSKDFILLVISIIQIWLM